MTRDTLLRILRKYGACRNAIAWVEDTPGTVAELWRTCNRADRMLWLAGRCIDRRKLVMTACACARTALPYARSATALTAIETAEAWCRGEATSEQVRDAADAARAYAVAYAVAHAADAATYAVCASVAIVAYTAAYESIAYDVTVVAHAAAYNSAYNSAYDADYDAAMSRMADIVREHITAPEIIAALSANQTGATMPE